MVIFRGTEQGASLVVARFISDHPEFVPLYQFAGEPGFVEFTKTESEFSDAKVQAELFASLAAIIIHQQLSGKVAKVFEARLSEACGGVVVPEVVLSLGESGLRSLGLSNAKTRAVVGLAEEVLRGELSFDAMGEMSDEEIAGRICKLFGFGPWSAHMFLLFSLGRLNVWAPADLGVRKGYARLYALDEMPTIREMQELGKSFEPLASLATWYLWRVLELPDEVTLGTEKAL